MRAIATHGRTIRVPAHAIRKITRIRRASRAIRHATGREPTTEELATSAHLPVKTVHRLLDAAHIMTVSTETLVGGGRSLRLGDLMADQSSISPSEAASRAEVDEHVRGLLATLTPVQEKVLRMRFGIGGAPEHTLEEIGRQFSVSRERIRRIQVEALSKLRTQPRSSASKSLVEK
jgi:RNA polymerase primary sigma factor